MTEDKEAKAVATELATGWKEGKSAFLRVPGSTENPWVMHTPDKMELDETKTLSEYRELIHASRFFYKHDPLVATAFNKMIDMSITNLHVSKARISDNVYNVISAMVDELEVFAANMALEYLLCGLVIPEVKYTPADRKQFESFGIKRYQTLVLPTTMWLRDPGTVVINSPLFGGNPSYFVEIPDKMIFFFQSKGEYPDGTKDTNLYQQLVVAYPQLVQQIQGGQRKILLENDLLFTGRIITPSPYPIPYLSSIVESLKHKRNIRRMDYSIAARVISAIQLFRLGSDEYPVTADQEDQFEDIKNQMYYRQTAGLDMERIFQLFANHTLQIDWIFPPTDALLDENKYSEVNHDIIAGLGFPKILMTGEADKSGTSNPEFASMSPVKTMEAIRTKVLRVLNKILDYVMTENNLRGTAKLEFDPINLRSFNAFVTGIQNLYDSGNLSREDYARIFGYDLEDQLFKKASEAKVMKELQIEEFAPKPYSPQPTKQGATPVDNQNLQGQTKNQQNQTVPKQ